MHDMSQPQADWQCQCVCIYVCGVCVYVCVRERERVKAYLILCKQCFFFFAKGWVFDVVELCCGAQVGTSGPLR